MRWLWFLTRAGARPVGPAEQEWRRLWAEIVDAPDASRADDLRRRLPGPGPSAVEESWEIEREMMEGLDALVRMVEHISSAGLPTVATGHRAAGDDACHFTAKVSLPDDLSHPAGTLLVTPARLVFVGGGRRMTLPWHAVSACVRQGRDLVLARADRQETCRIRHNSFADVLQVEFLARRLVHAACTQRGPDRRGGPGGADARSAASDG